MYSSVPHKSYQYAKKQSFHQSSSFKMLQNLSDLWQEVSLVLRIVAFRGTFLNCCDRRATGWFWHVKRHAFFFFSFSMPSYEDNIWNWKNVTFERWMLANNSVSCFTLDHLQQSSCSIFCSCWTIQYCLSKMKHSFFAQKCCILKFNFPWFAVPVSSTA